VERDEFRKGVAEMRMKIEPEAVESLIRFLDPDNNGKIDYSEFAEVMTPPKFRGLSGFESVVRFRDDGGDWNVVVRRGK
jgi:hypothetical protein